MTRGFQVEAFGGPELMIWREITLPVLGAHDIEVIVKASGVNFAEVRMRAGDYGGQEIPFIMGMEASGIVKTVGAEVEDFSVGDRVFGRARGTHAESVIFTDEHLMHLPDRLSFVEGAAIAVGWLTAWHALHTVARIKSGQRVLIEAVGGSVGSAALQIAKEAHCWVAGTASTDEKLASARQWGSDLTVNYCRQSVIDEIMTATDGLGADVSLMTIGQATATDLIDSMGMDGKVVMFGSTGGRDITFNLKIGILNLQLLSMSISTSPDFMSLTMPDFKSRALPLFAEGLLKPVVDTVLPMSELVKAHEMIASRQHFGKIIMTNDNV
jgi:NADPH:quinone reductase-like Zn-dependent oxidoreductase